MAIEPMPGHPSGEKLCPKGQAAPELVYHKDRLTVPLRRTAPKGAADPSWQPIAWDEALDEIARRMRAIKTDHGPEQVAFSVTTPSGTHIANSISWIERLIRGFGSPNIIYATEICNWHKDIATCFSFGHNIGTPDFAATDCVLLWGNNPTATWLARAVEVQKALKRGARMIVVDPRPTALAKRADQWLRVLPGTDQVLALGLAHLLIEKQGFDRRFMVDWTNGPLLVRSDTGRLLRQSDMESAGRSDVLYASCNSQTGQLLPYDSSRGIWLDQETEAERERKLQARIDLPIGGSIVSCRTAFDIYAAAAAEYRPARVVEITGVTTAALGNAVEILGRGTVGRVLCVERRRSERGRDADEQSDRAALCLDGQLRGAGRQRPREGRGLRRHLRAGASGERAAGEGARACRASPWPRPDGMGDGPRRLPGRYSIANLIRCGCSSRSVPTCSVLIQIRPWRSVPSSAWSFTFTLISS